MKRVKEYETINIMDIAQRLCSMTKAAGLSITIVQDDGGEETTIAVRPAHTDLELLRTLVFLHAGLADHVKRLGGDIETRSVELGVRVVTTNREVESASAFIEVPAPAPPKAKA